MIREIQKLLIYNEEENAEILRAYYERSCLQGLEYTFGVSHHTVVA